MVKISTVTFYLNEAEKAKIREIASEKNLTVGKFASQIVRAWVQKRMPEEED